jgi:hypothetical protein
MILMEKQDELAALKDRNAELEARMNLAVALLHDSMATPGSRSIRLYRRLADKWRWLGTRDKNDA